MHRQRAHTDRPAGRSRSVVVVFALTIAVLGWGATATAAPPTADPATGAELAADWLSGQISAEGYVNGFGGTPDAGATMDVALSLAATATHEIEFDRTVGWLAANAESVIAGGGADSPAALGELLLVADAAGLDPTSFGGVDLPARLGATLGLHAAGLYGAADPTYDGVYRQGLALLGLVAHDITPPPVAVAWLVDQQCDAATPAAQGGWMAYRVDTTVACGAGFSGPDTNQTAMAVQALAAVGTAVPFDARAFLVTAQDSGGGFAYVPGGSADPNSTALVIQALVASGIDPAAAPWAVPGGTPLTSLLAWQLGEGPDRGALASPYSSGTADPFATRQAPWGLAEAPFPLGRVRFPEAPSMTTSTSVATTATTIGTTTSTTSASAPAAGAAPAAVAVTTAVRFTG